MLPQQLNDWRFWGSLRPSSHISYIDFLNSELNFKLSSYFEKPFKLNNSKKKTPLNTTKLIQPHLCYSLPIVCSVFPSCFQASTHFHIEIPTFKSSSNYVLFLKIKRKLWGKRYMNLLIDEYRVLSNTTDQLSHDRFRSICYAQSNLQATSPTTKKTKPEWK